MNVAELPAPQDQDMEEAVIAACIRSRDALVTALAQLDDSAFFVTLRNRYIWDAILTIARRDDPVDLVSVVAEMRNLQTLERIAEADRPGSVVLTGITELRPSSANIESYVNKVYDKWVLRSMIESSREVIAAAYRPETQAAELLASAQDNLYRLSEGREQTSFVHIGQVLPKVMDRIQGYQRGERQADGLPTGFSDLDQILFGLGPGQMITLAGLPGMGKTTLAMTIAEHIAINQQRKVGILSLEMEADELAEKALLSQAGFSSDHVRSQRLTADDWDRLSRAANRLSTGKIIISALSRLTPALLRSQGRLLARARGCELLVVDHIHLMSTDSSRESMVDRLGEISRSVKSLAMELHVPVLALAQLNRGSAREGLRRPRLDDLRGSGSIEADSNKVIFVHRPDFYLLEKENIVEVIVAKHRSGPQGMCWLEWADGRIQALDQVRVQQRRDIEVNKERGLRRKEVPSI